MSAIVSDIFLQLRMRKDTCRLYGAISKTALFAFFVVSAKSIGRLLSLTTLFEYKL